MWNWRALYSRYWILSSTTNLIASYMLTSWFLSDLNSDLSTTNVKSEMRYDYWEWWLGWDLDGDSHDGLPHHFQKKEYKKWRKPSVDIAIDWSETQTTYAVSWIWTAHFGNISTDLRPWRTPRILKLVICKNYRVCWSGPKCSGYRIQIKVM